MTDDLRGRTIPGRRKSSKTVLSNAFSHQTGGKYLVVVAVIAALIALVSGIDHARAAAAKTQASPPAVAKGSVAAATSTPAAPPSKPAVVALAPLPAKPAPAPLDPDTMKANDAYASMSKFVSTARLAATIKKLSSVPSRVVGYPGHDIARDYVIGQFQSILGPAQVKTENFDATVPMDDGSSRIMVGGVAYKVNPLWPNLVRSSTLPEAGVTGRLIYGGQGDLSNFNGKPVAGSIVLMDFNSGTRWLNAARLGAAAVVFAEPDNSIRGEAEAKFAGVPISVPRFWISRHDAASLEASALTTPDVTATLTCNEPWEVKTATNVVGMLDAAPGGDPAMRSQVMVIETYYDSMSVVPGIAPGAESSSGIAAMLELARAFKAHPPSRPVMFVATDAHFLGLQGIREYIDRHVDEWLPISTFDRINASLGHSGLPTRKQVYLFTSLDLSSQSPMFGVFYKGNFYSYREDLQPDFSDIGRTFRENAAKIGGVLGFDPTARLADGINPIGGKVWQTYLPGQFAFDGEVAALAGGKAVTLATCDDDREKVDTPADTFRYVNIANIQQQTILLACEYWHLLNDTNKPDSLPAGSKAGIMPISDYPAWSRQGLRLGFSDLEGRELTFNPRSSFVPSTPVPAGALIVVHSPVKTFTGVRGNLIQAPTVPVTMVNGKPMSGMDFKFCGLPLVTSQATEFGNGTTLHVDAFRINDADVFSKKGDLENARGQIDFAPDLGANGAVQYPNDVSMTGPTNSVQVVMFPCTPTSLFDLVDQANLQTLTGIQILDGASNGDPRQYGYVLSTPLAQQSTVEDFAVIFTDPKTRIKVLMNSGIATRFVLINAKQIKSTDKEAVRAAAEGSGYNLADPSDPVNPTDPSRFVNNGVVANTPYWVAHDLWVLDDFRIKQLEKYRIIDKEIDGHYDPNDPGSEDGIHVVAGRYLDQARLALRAKNYAQFDALSRAAWGFESRVYPRAQDTASDVVKGVLFYLFLMIPFAYFMERLFVASPDLKRQLSWLLGIFVVLFAIFSQIHPAFDITGNPGIVLIAFIMLALSLLVSSMVWTKFEDEMQKINRATSGVHKVDVGKAGIAFAAFSLGISNMRRRKARTVLTSITLILLTFIVLSFTSIVPAIRYNEVEAPGPTTYPGFMLRSANWDPLQSPAYRLLSDRYGDAYPVAPRAWLGTSSVKRGDISVDVKGVSGLAPQESHILRPQDDLIAGRWFEPGDTNVAILPDGVAGPLGIDPSNVGKATVTFSGQEFTVIAIIDGKKLGAATDLDDEPITPVDFTASQAAQSTAGTSSSTSSFQPYVHMDPEACLYLPYTSVINMGGKLESVAIGLNSASNVNNQLDGLKKSLDLNLYIGTTTPENLKANVNQLTNYRFSAVDSTSGSGLGNIIIPLLIAGLIVLNTMLNSVFERVKEIGIFSSLGLTPGNIAMLFVAEALVFAVIGSVSGYLIGQGLSKLIATLNILPGLNLNFSSTSAMLSTAAVAFVVLASTIIPARKASEVATPAVDRVWKLPEPEGDDWRIALPFAITGNQAQGINGYLSEWLHSYIEQSVGDFLVQDVSVSGKQFEHGHGYSLSAKVWLAPFDLGVSQTMRLETAPTALEDVYEVVMHLHRTSGDVSNWKRVNRRFLNVVRKQFLIWRTLSAESREHYIATAAGSL